MALEDAFRHSGGGVGERRGGEKDWARAGDYLCTNDIVCREVKFVSEIHSHVRIPTGY